MDNTIIEVLKKTLKDIEGRGDTLTRNGYYMKGALVEKEPLITNDMLEEKRLHMLFSIIPLIFKTSERKTVGSYGSKHLVARFFNHQYFSNGEFIIVMIALGYKYKVRKDSINVTFYGSWVDTADQELKYKFM